MTTELIFIIRVNCFLYLLVKHQRIMLFKPLFVAFKVAENSIIIHWQIPQRFWQEMKIHILPLAFFKITKIRLHFYFTKVNIFIYCSSIKKFTLRNSPPVESKLYFVEQITELGWWVKQIRSVPCFLWYVVLSNLKFVTQQ